MKDKDGLIRIYTGTDVTVHRLKSRLEEVGISSIIQNDFKSGIAAGFSGGGVPSAIDLYIKVRDKKKAEPIIKEFRQSNQE